VIKPSAMFLMAFKYVFLIVESDGIFLSIIVSAGLVLMTVDDIVIFQSHVKLAL
jgi:hypothetical protein